MSDFDTAPIDVPAPSTPAPSPAPAPDPSEIINERRHTTLSQLAKDESVEAYAQEREDQAAAIDRGEDLPQERQNQWYRRAHKALNEAAGIQPQDQSGEPTYVPSEYGPEPEQAPDCDRKLGVVQERIRQHFGGDAEKRQAVIDWGQALDPESHVANWVIESQSELAGPIMQRLGENPEAWRQLAEMPPRERERWLSKLEGHLETEMRIGQQLAQQQQQWQQQRRTSNAPPPIRPPRGGGVLPPRDAFQLASKGEDVSDYVRMRQQQEKRRG